MLFLLCLAIYIVLVSSTQTVTLSFERPVFGYDSSYCMLLTPDNSNAVLTYNCNGDLNIPTITPTPKPTILKTVTSAAVATTTRTTITTEQFLASLGSTTVNVLTTAAGVFTVTSETSKTISSPSLSATTTKTPISFATTIENQTSTSISNSWIPALGASMTLTFVIILVVCYYERKIRNGKSNNKNNVYDGLGNDINSDRSYSNLTDVTGIYATIEENARNEGTTSRNTMERTISYLGVHVQQPIQDVPGNTYKNTYTNYARSDGLC